LKEFRASDYEDRFNIFNKTLDDPELMDKEMAFEMLHDLFFGTIKRRKRNRFDALVETLCERLPATYKAEAPYFLKWRITNALVDARPEDVAALFAKLAPLAGKEIDIFNRVEEMVACHGQLPALVDCMRLAWPAVKSSSDIVPWGIDEFCTRAISYEILNFADQTAEPAPPNAELIERLNFYPEVDPERVAAYLAHLTNREGCQWTMNDFALSPPDDFRMEEDDEEVLDVETVQSSGELNLYYLNIEFLGYLRRVEGVPYARGELGRRELHQFILDRHNGRLEYRESMLESGMRDINRKKGRRLKPKRKFSGYEHILVPDPERLEYFLANLLDMMNQLYHRTSAFFEIIPAWLRFLKAKQLIDAETRTQAMNQLARLAISLGRILEKYTGDPAPGQALAEWREKYLSRT
jgi:hypothetical protein